MFDQELVDGSRWFGVSGPIQVIEDSERGDSLFFANSNVPSGKTEVRLPPGTLAWYRAVLTLPVVKG